MTPLVKSSALTSGRTFSRMTSPAIVGVNFSLTPNSLYVTFDRASAADDGIGNSPPARKLAS